MVQTKKYNKSVLLSSDCTKNKKLPIKLNKLINSKFKKKESIKISVLITAKLNFKKTYKAMREKAIKLFRKQEKKLKINKDYSVEFIDCSQKSNIEKCTNSIKNCDVIWVMGGDTLYLWYHIKKTNIDKLICNKVNTNKAIYVGCCAGAIIGGETINPTFIARFYKKSRKYNLTNIYKKNFWNKIGNKKTLKFIKNKDILPHCKTKKSKIMNLYNNRTKMFCLPEYKPLIK